MNPKCMRRVGTRVLVGKPPPPGLSKLSPSLPPRPALRFPAFIAPCPGP